MQEGYLSSCSTNVAEVEEEIQRTVSEVKGAIDTCPDSAASCTRVVTKTSAYIAKDINGLTKAIEECNPSTFEEKKIFTTYDIGKKKTSEMHDELDNYILFSLICLKIYEYTKNLKYLNTSLKLNDIISSNIRIIKKHNLSQIINFIIKNEIEMIKKLSKENDVVV